jgi:hypothetical protein
VKKYEGFWMLKVRKTPSLRLLLKNEYKIHGAYRSTDQPVTCVSAVRLLHQRGYLNRRASEKLSQHLLLLSRCVVEIFY